MKISFMLKFTRVIILLVATNMGYTAFSQEETSQFIGYVKDAITGEALPGSTVFDLETKLGTSTNENGFFKMRLINGKHDIRVSFVGYETIEKHLNLPNDKVINIFLTPNATTLNEISVNAQRANQNVVSTQMGMQKLDNAVIRDVAAFLGEVDAIKVLQLLPGIQATSEGSSGFSVRGGSPDQNLIVLDNVPVYSASHLLGFFSVFNNDVIEDLTIYKGDIPAKAGGRLSSYLDITTKNGKLGRIEGQGGVGTISSRLTLQGGITPKTSFIVGGRRTYADLALKFSPDENARNSQLYFYDLNAKISHNFNENNRLFINGYMGDDYFLNNSSGVIFGNTLGSTRWYHVFNENLRSDLTVYSSDYRYKFQIPEGSPASFEWTSSIRDYGIQYDVTYDASDTKKWELGLSSMVHSFEPGTFKGVGDSSFFGELKVDESKALEHGLYASINRDLGNRVKLKAGLRLSAFQSMGASTIYNYNDDFVHTDSMRYASGEIYNTYMGLEPRLGLTFLINKSTSVKTGYSRNIQYLQLAQNSTSGTPIDYWFPASPNIKPQKSDQIAVGIFKNMFDDHLELSLEGYHKWFINTIDFKDHADLFLNPYMEGEIRVGSARSYGLEFLARFDFSKWYGWISYTWSSAERTIPEINNGETYLAPYDKPHDVSLVFNYEILPRFTASLNWVYATGNPVTFPTGRFEYGGVIAPVYSSRNAYRMPDYHRMDLGLTYKFKGKESKRWKSELNFSVYNVYNRHNAWTINFVPEETNPNALYGEKTYLFPILPALTYNFKF